MEYAILTTAHGTVFAARYHLHRRLLLAGATGPVALYPACVAAPAGRSPVWSRPSEARRDAVPWRVRGRTDSCGLSGGRLVRRSDTATVGADRGRASQGRKGR